MGQDERQVTDADLEVLAEQLGRKPRGVIGIASRCPAGHPQVVINEPLLWQDGRLQIFPTIYWLTCPHLVKGVSRLEADGRVGVFTERYTRDPDRARQLAKAHADYARTRMSLISEDVQGELAEKYPGQFSVLQSSGVGGTRPGSRGVKCLHTHLAHYLAGGDNPVGREVSNLLAERGIHPCGDARQKNSDSE